MPTHHFLQVRPAPVAKATLPAVLTIAGSDSSGGAGIEADLKTFAAHGVYGLTCITALTAQNTQQVSRVEKTSKKHLKEILERNLDDFVRENDQSPLEVVKTGMLTKDAVEVLVEYLDELKRQAVKLVVDPVMVSTTGTELFDVEALDLCVKNVIRKAYLVTPNYVEALALSKAAARLSQGKPLDTSIESLDDFSAFVMGLQKQLGCENLLVKGGHIPWDKTTNRPSEKDSSDKIIVDILYQSASDTISVYESEYIETTDTHGTGCTLALAIASNVAKNEPLERAVGHAIGYVHLGILAQGRKLGHGHGPLNHNIKASVTLSPSELGGKAVPTSLVSGSALSFFTSHPSIKPAWERYVNHPFLHQLATNKLPFERFLYFLKQDFYYLVNYAQVHGLAASVAPTYQQIHAEATIIESVIDEIQKHKAKLQHQYNIDYDHADLDSELQPGAACLNYCNFLLEKGKTEDFLGIKVALAPCLHGYYEAAVYANKIKDLDESQSAKVYGAWIEDYDSDWYKEAYDEGVVALDELIKGQTLTPERLDDLIETFRAVTELEVAFWDEVVQ